MANRFIDAFREHVEQKEESNIVQFPGVEKKLTKEEIDRIVGGIAEKREDEFLAECRENLGLKSQKEAKKLVNIIWNIRKDRKVTVLTREENYVQRIYPKNISADLLSEAKKNLFNVVCFGLCFDGCLILRCAKRREKDEVSAFLFKGGRISPLSEEQVREACSQNPDGTVSDWSDIEMYVCYDIENLSERSSKKRRTKKKS